ncbi:hypothetical protein DRO25_02735 [Candidatus Bathyarchaeota archaeon]|nr:MAG: hypothetical protein DRO25_02735 [Candidatus Bathyarchaeota archaeon]
MKNTNLLADAIVTLSATIFNATSVERLKDCWDDSSRMLAIALANFVIGLIALKVSIGVAFLNALFNIVSAGATSALYLLQNKVIVAAEPIQAVGRTWVDYAELGMDFSFGVTALARFLGCI